MPDMVMTDPGDMALVKQRIEVAPVSATGHDRFFGVTYDKAGAIYATGVVADGTDAMTNFKTVVAKFDREGAPVRTFGQNGFAIHDIAAGTNGETARGIVVQSTGRIVVAATVEHKGAVDARDRDLALVAFTSAGMLDATFGDQGVTILDLSDGEVVGMAYLADAAWGLAVYPDDRLVVSGSQKRAGATDSDFAVVRLSANGQRDATFGTNGVFTLDIDNVNASARGVSILPDESVLASGYMTSNMVTRPVVFKLDKMGKPDPSFGTAGLFNRTIMSLITEVYAVTLKSGRIVTGGYGRDSDKESLDFVSLGISAQGKLDPAWGTNGFTRIDVAGFNENCRHVVALPDDRVMLVGGGRPTMDTVDGMVAVLGPTGQPDETFGTKGFRLFDFGGAADHLWSAAVAPDGRSVAVAGIKGVGTAPGNDDGVLMVMPIGK